jgi:hypothetical protein
MASLLGAPFAVRVLFGDNLISKEEAHFSRFSAHRVNFHAYKAVNACVIRDKSAYAYDTASF